MSPRCGRFVTSLMVLALASGGLRSLSAQSRGAPAPFLAVEWGAGIDTVMARAASAGWDFVRVDEDSDFVFRTRVGGHATTAYVSFGPRGLARVEYGVRVEQEAALTYQALVDTLTDHYGLPSLATGENSDVRPSARMLAASAWPGVLLGLRRDGWVAVVFLCPENSPPLPLLQVRGVLRRT